MSIQQAIDAYWTERAPSYDAYQQRPERRDLDRAVWAEVWTQVLPPPPADVLDVGTGSGQVACLLADLGHRVTGLDRAEGMLALARAHAVACAQPPRILAGDAVDPDLPPGSFDAVTGRYVMWTLRDPVAAVRSWVRLLRPGGVVAMVDSTWFPDGLGDLYATDMYDETGHRACPLAEATTIEATARALTDGGLADVRITPLEAVLDLDRRLGVAPDHEVRLQYLVTGRRGPAA